jgi:predicted nucleic acid-binding protein
MSAGTVVITDASVIINFSHADILKLLPELTGLSFIVTDVVYDEVRYPDQRAKLDDALKVEGWTCESVTDPAAIALQAELMTVMDKGEASSLAMAVVRTCIVACDEGKVFLAQANARLGTGRVVNTPGLLLIAIKAGRLSVEEADRIKALLETKRFKMKFGSFADLL